MKKRFRGLLAMVLIASLLFGSGLAIWAIGGEQKGQAPEIDTPASLTVHAQGGDFPVKVELTSNKDKMLLTGKVKFTATITNISNSTINNISAEAIFGRDIVPVKKDSQITATNHSLAPGQSFSFSYNARVKGVRGLDFLFFPFFALHALFNAKLEIQDNAFDSTEAFEAETKNIKITSISSGYDVSSSVKVYFKGEEIKPPEQTTTATQAPTTTSSTTTTETHTTTTTTQTSTSSTMPSTTTTTTKPNEDNQFKFTSFTASPFIIEIGTPTEVTFTATVETDIVLPAYSIYVYHIEGNQNITYLTDNGDGTFSWAMTLTGEENQGTASFQAKYEGYASEVVELHFQEEETEDDGTESAMNKNNDIPSFINEKTSNRKIENIQDAIYALNDVKTRMKMNNPIDEFEEKRVDTDQYGTYYRLQQVHEGIPVYGKELVVATDNNKYVKSISGDYDPDINLNTTPKISEQEAIEIVIEKSPYTGNPQSYGLVIYELNDNHILSWYIGTGMLILFPN